MVRDSVTSVAPRRLRRLLLITATLGPLVGCVDPNAPSGSGQKEAVGTGADAITGGGLGCLIGHVNGRIVAGLVGAGLAGAGLGALRGNRIGAALDAQDCEVLVARQRQALQSQSDQQPVAWTADHSNASATITHVERKTLKIMRQADVAEPTDLEAIGARYQTWASTRIHVFPDKKSADGALAKGDHLWVVGRLRAAPWLVVARNGKSVGYVSSAKMARLVHSAEYAAAAVPSAPIVPRLGAAPTGAACHLDAADAVLRQPADRDAPQNGDKVDLVSADVTCRDLSAVQRRRQCGHHDQNSLPRGGRSMAA